MAAHSRSRTATRLLRRSNPATAGDRQKVAAIDRGALREELLRRHDIDRAARSAYSGAPVDMARPMELDYENTAWLKMIVGRVGWPGHSLFGEDAAHAAWLIAQRADLNPAFQQRYLELLRGAAERGNASRADLAYLTDRVLLARREPQLFGTQLAVSDGVYVPPPIREPETVHVRRDAMGLGHIALHLGPVPDRYQSPRLGRGACPNCGEVIEVRLPNPGGTMRFKCPACQATGTVNTRPRLALPPAQLAEYTS